VFYRQLPVRSPITLRGLVRAAGAALRLGADPRPELKSWLRGRYHARGVALCGSGTDALRLALEAVARQRPGGVLLLPAYTCYDVATAAVGAGAPVALYDVDPATLQPHWASVREAAGAGAAGLVVAPLHGIPVDWDVAREIAGTLGALLIEDAAQGQGMVWQGRPVGSYGDLSVLSFGRGKGWTGAGGGALLWRGDVGEEAAANALAVDRAAASLLSELRTLLAAAVQWLLGRPALYALPAKLSLLGLGETRYHPPSAPRPLTRPAAALLLSSRTEASHEATFRRAIAAEYARWLTEMAPGSSLFPAAAETSGALRFPVLSPALQPETLAARGVTPGYPRHLGELPALRPQLVRRKVALPGATLLARQLVTLPSHSATTAAERALLRDVLRGTLGKADQRNARGRHGGTARGLLEQARHAGRRAAALRVLAALHFPRVILIVDDAGGQRAAYARERLVGRLRLCHEQVVVPEIRLDTPDAAPPDLVLVIAAARHRVLRNRRSADRPVLLLTDLDPGLPAMPPLREAQHATPEHSAADRAALDRCVDVLAEFLNMSRQHGHPPVALGPRLRRQDHGPAGSRSVLVRLNGRSP
jgi:perosamine synthetase